MSFHSRGPSRPAQPSLSDEEVSALVSVTTTIVTSCVREPEQVDVNYDPRQGRLLVEVASKDRGALIGRGGKNLRALEDALALAQQYRQSIHGASHAALPMIDLVTRRDQTR